MPELHPDELAAIDRFRDLYDTPITYDDVARFYGENWRSNPEVQQDAARMACVVLRLVPRGPRPTPLPVGHSYETAWCVISGHVHRVDRDRWTGPRCEEFATEDDARSEARWHRFYEYLEHLEEDDA